MALAAPKPAVMPLLVSSHAISDLPSVNSTAVIRLPSTTSAQPMRARGMPL